MSSRVTAESLYLSANTSSLKDHESEILRDIDIRIQEKNQQGIAELMYHLLESFPCGSLEPNDTQLIVYSNIIEDLSNRGFHVVLGRTERGSPYLRIRWPSILDPKEKARMKKIIQDHIGK